MGRRRLVRVGQSGRRPGTRAWLWKVPPPAPCLGGGPPARSRPPLPGEKLIFRKTNTSRHSFQVRLQKSCVSFKENLTIVSIMKIPVLSLFLTAITLPGLNQRELRKPPLTVYTLSSSSNGSVINVRRWRHRTRLLHAAVSLATIRR